MVEKIVRKSECCNAIILWRMHAVTAECNCSKCGRPCKVKEIKVKEWSMPAKNELREKIGKEVCRACEMLCKNLPNCDDRISATDKILAAAREKVKEIHKNYSNTHNIGVNELVSDLLRELGEGEM